MRKLTVTFALVLLAFGFSIAQTQQKESIKAERNYLHALNHENSGVVESAIVKVMILKLHYPEKDYKQLIDKLDELSLEGSPMMIRVKASIARNYLKYPERFMWIANGDYEQTKDFFELYTERIEQQVNRNKTALSMNN